MNHATPLRAGDTDVPIYEGVSLTLKQPFGFKDELYPLSYKIINILLNHNSMADEIVNFPGLIPDPRSEEAKEKDYQHSEVAPMAVVLKWNRGLQDAPNYSQRDQNGSGSCVAQSSAKALEVLRKEVISAHPIYARRKNLGSPGMWLQDAGDIVKKLGTTTELLDPSQKMSEADMNKPVGVTTPINGYLYVFADVKNIDEIATAIELYGHCKITVGCNGAEWSEKPVYSGNPLLNFFHDTCATYYFTDENGNKCLRDDESWGLNNPGHRILTEAFLMARGTGAMYHIPPLPTPPTPGKPKFHFTSILSFGQENYSIKMLQDILKYEGLFPINVFSSGKYLQVTAKAVDAFQRKHNVAPISELDALAKETGGYGRRVGAKTIAMLNHLYDN